MERDEQLVLEQIAEKQSKLEALTYQQVAIQRDLDAVNAQIATLQADVDVLNVKFAPVIEKQTLGSREGSTLGRGVKHDFT